MNFAKLEILVITAVLFLSANALAEKYEVGASPYGPEDEVGALNEVSDTMIKQALSSVVSGQVYDLAVEFFLWDARATDVRDRRTGISQDVSNGAVRLRSDDR